MNENIKWWFAPAGHGEIKGENTGDKELFKKDTYVSLAREIVQNSIDARDSDEKPVKIEFKEFEIEVNNIPGLSEYKSQIKRVISYWKTNKDFKKKYEDILRYLDTNYKIKCLRISDFNTTGLNGIEISDSTADNAYNALVKGTGISKKKTDFAGGSKGVGKNVPFLLSKLMTVFYVTKTNDNNFGSVGVSKLASGYIDDNEEDNQRDYTQGTGYYAYSDMISPITDYLCFDNEYDLRKNNNGTDIYILGFEASESWLKDVISSTLDSFMASIVRNNLIVSFNNIEIDSNSLKDFIHSDYIDLKYKKSIIAQYSILKNIDGRVKSYDIETELGNAQMFILPYKRSEESLATKKCAMIRTPMMLIKNYDLAFCVSAMVIIGEGILGKMLRGIENPQHKDWEIKRIKDISERKEVEAAINSMREQINNNVLDCLKLGDDSPIDPNGAGEFLALEEEGEEKGAKSKSLDLRDEACVGKIRVINYRENNANIQDDEGYGQQPDIGIIDENDDGEENSPSGNNNGDGGEPRDGLTPGDKICGYNEIITKACLTGVKYKVISTNKVEGKLKIIFTSPESHNNCYLNLSLLDDANSITRLQIQSLFVNNTPIEIKDFYEPGIFKIQKNEKTIIDVKVDKDDYFACEVKVKYENR